ncbi:hypothetical protein ABIE45_004638 [Methylobacterium sp. OAE515]
MPRVSRLAPFADTTVLSIVRTGLHPDPAVRKAPWRIDPSVAAASRLWEPPSKQGRPAGFQRPAWIEAARKAVAPYADSRARRDGGAMPACEIWHGRAGRSGTTRCGIVLTRGCATEPLAARTRVRIGAVER